MLMNKIYRCFAIKPRKISAEAPVRPGTLICTESQRIRPKVIHMYRKTTFILRGEGGKELIQQLVISLTSSAVRMHNVTYLYSYIHHQRLPYELIEEFSS